MTVKISREEFMKYPDLDTFFEENPKAEDYPIHKKFRSTAWSAKREEYYVVYVRKDGHFVEEDVEFK